MERAFIASQLDLFVHRLKTTCYLAMLIIGFTMLVNMVVFQHHRRTSFTSDLGFETTKVSFALLVGTGFFACLCMAFLSCKPAVQRVNPAVFEGAFLSIMCVLMVVFVLRTPDRIANMLGHSVEEAFRDKYFSDSHALLMIDMFVTVSHLGFPARWSSMLPLEVSSIVLYVVLVFGIGSHEPMANNIFSFCLLTLLVTFSALGKRAAEIQARQHFMDIIKERSLRCEAEFELSRNERREPKTRDLLSESHKTNGDSAPETMPGSEAFNMVYEEGVNISVQLSRVMELGDAEHWRIDEEEVKVLPTEGLGTGTFGQVTMAIFCGVMVAVKSPHDSLTPSDLKRFPAICNELRVMRHIRHPNLAAVLGAIVDPKECKIALVIELIRGTLLDKFLKSGPGPGEGRQPDALARCSVMLGVCSAILYLHTRRPHVVHGDIKGSNIMIKLVNDSVEAKVLDFGLSRVLTRNPRPLGGSLAYIAPEVFLRDGPVRCSADIYSFGRLVAFVATGSPPQSSMTTDELKQALRERRPPPPSWPRGCIFKPKCRSLVKRCIRTVEEERPGIREVHRCLLALSGDLGTAGHGGQLLLDVATQLREEGLPVPLSFLPPEPEQQESARGRAEGSATEGGRADGDRGEERLREKARL